MIMIETILGALVLTHLQLFFLSRERGGRKLSSYIGIQHNVESALTLDYFIQLLIQEKPNLCVYLMIESNLFHLHMLWFCLIIISLRYCLSFSGFITVRYIRFSMNSRACLRKVKTRGIYRVQGCRRGN